MALDLNQIFADFCVACSIGSTVDFHNKSSQKIFADFCVACSIGSTVDFHNYEIKRENRILLDEIRSGSEWGGSIRALSR